MYTVMRFSADTSTPEAVLERLGASVNLFVAGAFERLDHAGNRFSMSVSAADNWGAHVEAIKALVQELKDVIGEAQARGVSVTIDVAVEPEDLNGKPLVSCEVSATLLHELAQHDVSIAFTFYGYLA